MKSENKSDRHLVVGSLEVLQEITGGAIRTIQTEIKDTAQTAKTLGADFKDFFTQMTFDNFISPAEKKILKKEHDQIVLDYPLVCAHAIEIGILTTDERYISYKAAYDNLYTYLYSTIQVFDEMDKETTLAQRSNFNDIWNAYYAALTTIQINVNNEIINGYSSGTQVEAPDTLTLSSAIAEQNKIVLTAQVLGQGLKNSLKKVIFHIQKTVGGVWEEYENESFVFEYFFDRATDGYPEAGTYAAKDLGNWTIRAKAVNIYGKVSADYSNGILVNTDKYGTWNVLPPVISAQSANRAANVTWQRKDKTPLGKDIYGISFFDIQISMNGSTWFKPAQGKTGKVSEADWQDGAGQVRLSGGGWSQALPLTGQTLGLPVNTTYYYRVRTIGITEDYLSAWSSPVTAIALATGIGDIIAGSVTEQILAPDAVTYEKLNVLAVNKINSFAKGKNDYWTTFPDAGTKNCTIETDAETGLQCGVLSSNLNGITNSNKFEVLPDDILEVNITVFKDIAIGTTYIGLQSYAETPNWNCQYANYNTIAKSWGTFNNSSNFYFLTTPGSTTRLTLKTYIVGYNVTPDKIPAPNIATACARMLPGQTKANLRVLNFGNAGTTTKLYILAPRVINIASGQLLANQIITPSLSAINANVGEITSGILRAIIKAGESKPNVFLDLDTEEFRVGNNPSLEDSNHEDAEYLHWKPNLGLFLKLKNLIVDALASTIRGRFRVRGTTATIAQSVLIVNPESTVDPDTNTPANTTVIKIALQCPAGITGNLTGNASTATLAIQALAIKPLGNSITLAPTPTSVTKIIKIATVDWIYAGSINITCAGANIEDGIKVYINGAQSLASGIRVLYGKNNVTYGIKKIIVALGTTTWNSNRQIYAEIVTSMNNPSTTTLGIVETHKGTFTPSMTEVSSVEGTVVDSISLNYVRGDISSYQHVFTKNIIGNLTGNASTADKWKTARNISISDADGTNTGTAVVVDGSENETLKLPATIKANVTGNADTASKANVRVSLRHGNTWFAKTFAGLNNFSGESIKTDGENIYYISGVQQFVLNKTTSTWTAKVWTNIRGYYNWTDGDNIYNSDGAQQYVLNKETSTWVTKTWTGLTNFNGQFIWTDGENIYYSYEAQQYVLNKETSTWVTKTWTNLTDFYGQQIWTDGENICYSRGSQQFVLNKETSTWVAKAWTGLTNFNGGDIWTDGENIYYSYEAQQYVLNKETSTWVTKTWTNLTDFYGRFIWTDGDNIYYSNATQQYVLPATRHNYVDDNKYNSLFGTVTRCNCSTLSDRFVFRNE